jgi:FKBP-type peptidyl-prolyl cis-trans isomerase/cyclophilin family peptidyl-prolyl cis-trans isomerase
MNDKRGSGFRSCAGFGVAAALAAFALTVGCGSPEVEEAAPGPPVVEIDTTLGRFAVELDVQRAPETVRNFLRYATDGYYNGTIFHRVLPDALIEGGGFNSRLERRTEGLRAPIRSEWGNGLANLRGTIGMVRESGEPDSATSAFYINVSDNTWLDEPQDGAGYAVFGRVVEGMEVIERIGGTQLEAHPANPLGEPEVPIVAVMIKSVRPRQFTMEAIEAEVERVVEGRRGEVEGFLANQETEARLLIQATEEEFGVEFVTTPSGLRYATLREGEGPTPPSASARVEVHYDGRLTHGQRFDSSYDRGAPATFPLDQVIPGWTEGVGSMRVGEKRRLIVPSDLAYGDFGRPPDIPGKATLVFDVELLAIR